MSAPVLTLTPLLYEHEFKCDASLFAVNYLKQRRATCAHQITALQLEMKALDTALLKLDVGFCTACAGAGKVWVHYAQDECKQECCNRCDGTGRTQQRSEDKHG